MDRQNKPRMTRGQPNVRERAGEGKTEGRGTGEESEGERAGKLGGVPGRSKGSAENNKGKVRK